MLGGTSLIGCSVVIGSLKVGSLLGATAYGGEGTGGDCGASVGTVTGILALGTSIGGLVL